MNRSQLEHIIRAASRISGDTEIVVIGSQAIHAQTERLPPIVLQSMEADVYPRNHPERADEIDGAIGELSDFHQTFGYYAQGVSPQTAILPAGWQRRLVPLSSPNTEGATGLCLDVHDLALSKYAAAREKDIEFNRELVWHGIVDRRTLTRRVPSMPIDDERSASSSIASGAILPLSIRAGSATRRRPVHNLRLRAISSIQPDQWVTVCMI